MSFTSFNDCFMNFVLLFCYSGVTAVNLDFLSSSTLENQLRNENTLKK